jgi:hypothetical protein
MASEHPTLQSVVVVCPDRASRKAADRVAGRFFAWREVRRLYRPVNVPVNVVQWMIDDDPGRGRKAFETISALARPAVECLTESGVLTPTDSPPEPLDPEDLSYHFVSEWTWFVYQLAKTPQPGSLLRSYESRSIGRDRHPLEDGAVCWTLPDSIGIFEASALAIQRVLDDFQSDPAAGTAKPSTNPSKTPETTAGTTRESKGTIEEPTRNDLKLLIAMKRLGATDLACAVSRQQIVDRAKTGNAESKHSRESFNRLKAMELIETVPKAGTWLTESGLSLLAIDNR